MNYKIIQSAHNYELKHLAKLICKARYRQQQQLAVLEGVHLIQTFIQAGYLIQKIYLPQQGVEHIEIAALLTEISPDKIVLVADQLLGKISHLADSTEPMAIVAIPDNKENIIVDTDVVLLERVQNPGNVGTILRSALAAGIKQIVLTKDSVDVWSPRVLRAAMGAHAYLKLITVNHLSDWLAHYPNLVYATTLNSRSEDLYSLDLKQPLAWLFGNEGAGLSPEVLKLTSQHVMIPMLGKTESLNVAMAATICFFEQLRQRRLK